MTRKILAPLAAAAAFLLSWVPIAAAGGDGWTDDYEAAKAQAEKEKKDLLLDFTGSDWCGWCIKLKKEVFSQDAFRKEAPKNFVLVEVDFPRTKQLADKVRRQNDKLKGEFTISGYPTIYLADAKGRAFGKTGYQEGGPSKYLAALKDLQAVRKARDEFFEKAEKAEGVEKARLLDQGLACVEKKMGVLIGYDDVMADISRLDEKNEAGLKAKYEARAKLKEIEATANSGNGEGALRKIEEFVKDGSAPASARQSALFMKGQILFQKKDTKGAIAALEAARDADPQGELRSTIEANLKQIQAPPPPAPPKKKKK